MLRLSPSLIDAIEYFRHTEYQDADAERAKLAEVVAQIRGERTPDTDPMLRGRAFHKLVELRGRPVRERGVELVDGVYRVGMYATGEDGQRVLAVRHFDAAGIREFLTRVPADAIPEVKDAIEVDGVRVTVKCDALHGLDVHEFKSKEKAPDPEDYVQTIQWRLYLLGFGARRACYHVAQLADDDGVYRVQEVHAFDQYAYPRMAEDVRRRVADCVDFVRGLGLIDAITLREAA